MKIAISLDAETMSSEEKEYSVYNPMYIDWDLPFIPSEGNYFNVESIIGKPKDRKMWEIMRSDSLNGISWTVAYVDYIREDGEIIIHMNLYGA